jgi:nucleoside-diphosphate-sugar epimerase
MRIFLAGASGLIGRRLVPLLVDDGHVVTGMTRSEANAEQLGSLGAEPVVCDVFEADRLVAAVADAAPELVLHQLTDLPDRVESIATYMERNSRIRREGTRNLLMAAHRAGTERFLAQSVAWQLDGDAGAAVAEHEQMVLDAGGVVLRYGQFYGPGTYHEDRPPEPPRIHLDDAAARTVESLRVDSGVLTIAEDDPAIRPLGREGA